MTRIKNDDKSPDFVTKKDDERAADKYWALKNHCMECGGQEEKSAFLAGVSHEREKYRELVEALEFYSNVSNYIPVRCSNGKGEWRVDPPVVEREGGTLARKTLARLQDLEDGG